MVAPTSFDAEIQLSGEIDSIDARIQRREARLARRLARPQTEKRIAKIADLEAKLDADYAQRRTLRDQLTDQFNIRLEYEDGRSMFYVDIYDSPYDDTYEPNDALVLMSSVEGPKRDKAGAWKRSTLRTTLANGDYWEQDPITGGSQTVFVGGNMQDFTQYEFGTVSLAVDENPTEPWNDRVWDFQYFFSQDFPVLPQ